MTNADRDEGDDGKREKRPERRRESESLKIELTRLKVWCLRSTCWLIRPETSGIGMQILCWTKEETRRTRRKMQVRSIRLALQHRQRQQWRQINKWAKRTIN